MTSSSASPPSCPPRFTTRRTDRPTLGAAASRIADLLGTPLMPWQRHVVDVALEVDPATNRFVYRDVVVTVPRQAGKTTLLLAIMVWRALHEPGCRIVYTAQDGQAARKKWRDDQVPALNKSPLVSAFDVRYSNGDESIRWHNGSLHEVLSPTDRAGHGRQIDLAVVDEAFEFQDFRLDQGFSPAMITRTNPQMWIISTAGHADSTYLKAKVDRGRDAVRDDLTSGLAYFEWSADPEAAPDDPATWRSCIPSLGHTVSEESIAAEQVSKEPAEFERAYLNRWTSQVMASKIPHRSWEACVVDRSPGTDDAVFALDVSPDRSVSSIAVSDGAIFELADRRAGTEWVVSRCMQLWDQYRPVAFVVDAVGPASTLVPDLEAAGIRVEVTSHRQMAAACGRLYDAIVNRQVQHTDQPDMNAAVAAAATRKLGDAWAWSRSASSVDISPLVAATLALWGATTLEREAEAVSPPVFAY
jgi:phage terminase large subunit-like protein